MTCLAECQFRLKLNNGDRYKVWKDAAMTDEVISSTTELDATIEHTLYIEGLRKSSFESGESIKQVFTVGTSVFEADEVKFTVVQSEFLIQVKAFIPYVWTEGEDHILVHMVMAGQVALGDNDYKDLDRGFKNIYSDRTTNYDEAPFRMMQKITLTPFEDLHGSPDNAAERKAQAAALSAHYDKETSVPAEEQHLHYGYGELSGDDVRSDEAELNLDTYENAARSGGVSEITIRAKGEDGAMPWWTLDFPHDIEWNLEVKVDIQDDPLQPLIEVTGTHDRYPAYEIIAMDSSSKFLDIYRHSPAAGDLPGPTSLSNSNAITIVESGMIP